MTGPAAPAAREARVELVARALIAAWQRQEVEGRYRGADDFRALHIDPRDAVASWRAAVTPDAPWPTELATGFTTLTWPTADRLGLTAAERLVALLAVSTEWEPRLRPLVSALADDPGVRLPTLGLAAELAPAIGVAAAEVRGALDPDARLAMYDLVEAVAVDGRPSRLDAQLLASEWLVADGERPPPPELTFTHGVGALAAGRPIAVSGADHVRHAEQLATLGAVLLADAPDGAADLLTQATRAARAAGATLVVACTDRPTSALITWCERLAALGGPVVLSVERPVHWVSPAAWRRIEVSPLNAAERADRWRRGLAAAGLQADPAAVNAVAVDHALGAAGVDDAIARVVASGIPADETGLQVAARQTAWRDLSALAHRGPAGVSWTDLIVSAGVEARLREIAGALACRHGVLDEWGFGARPGGRGYHVLFTGPSGTGKTLSAAVIASAAGLELWVVDLARVVDKYLGETEKQIDRVLCAAESSGAMLLFDEADALFGRRGEVHEGRDRWANVEIAYLLQRIESHDGVSVLTTNVSHHLDEAFARRMSHRVEFPVPDAALRRQLWHRSVPAAAPVRDRGDLDTVADRFELAGGAIRTAAVNAAFAAAAEGGGIGLRHFVRASVGELTKAGREPTRAELGELFPLLGESAGAR